MSLEEQNYAVRDLEIIAIVMFGLYLHHYLEGAMHPMEFLTDHHNLQSFFTTKSLAGWQTRR